jgi:hypothetical protein
MAVLITSYFLAQNSVLAKDGPSIDLAGNDEKPDGLAAGHRSV